MRQAAPHVGRLIGIQPQPVVPSQPAPEPDRYRRRNYDYDKRFGVEEQLISGNRAYERTYNTTPGEKQDTTISVRAYPTGESIGVYRSPYFNGGENANEPMDVDSWNQVNDKIDAGKRSYILGHKDGGSVSKFQNSGVINNPQQTRKPSNYTQYNGDIDGKTYSVETVRPYGDAIVMERSIIEQPWGRDTTIITRQPGFVPDVVGSPYGEPSPRMGVPHWQQVNEMFDKLKYNRTK